MIWAIAALILAICIGLFFVRKSRQYSRPVFVVDLTLQDFLKLVGDKTEFKVYSVSLEGKRQQLVHTFVLDRKVRSVLAYNNCLMIEVDR